MIKLYAKRILCLAAAMLMVLALGSCGVMNELHIEDLNGEDDLMVDSISDDQAVKSNTHISTLNVKNQIDNITSVICQKLSGIYEVEVLRTNKPYIVLNIDSNVKSGNFRIIVTDGEKIVKDIPVNSDETIVLEGGTYYLKFVGESAEYSVEYSFEFKDKIDNPQKN